MPHHSINRGRLLKENFSPLTIWFAKKRKGAANRAL